MLSKVLETHVRLEKRVRSKAKQGKKINVLFLESCSNISKVSLLTEMASNNSDFNVTVLSHDQSDISKNLYQNTGAKLILGGSIEDVITHEDIDLLFLDNPHYYYDFLKPTHDFYKKLPASIFANVLICYIPYAYIAVSSHEAYTDFFHSYSWKFFLESYFHLTELKRYSRNIERISNQVVTGHPYIDPYLTNKYDFDKQITRKTSATRRVTWCPHHNPTFYGGVSILEQEKVLRELLELNTDLEIYFRPHPNFFAALKSKTHIDSKDYQTLLSNEIQEIFESYWLNNSRVIYYDKGPVYQLFKSSDLIIHNCGGYQMEAVASRAQIINLVSRELLNDHVLQFQKLQNFCSNKNDFNTALNEALDNVDIFEKDLTGHEDIPLAANLIIRNLQHNLL